MYKRSSSCGYYSIHLPQFDVSPSVAALLLALNLSIQKIRPPLSLPYSWKIVSFIHCTNEYIYASLTQVHIIKNSPQSSYYHLYCATFFERSIQRDHVSTHITTPIIHSEHLFLAFSFFIQVDANYSISKRFLTQNSHPSLFSVSSFLSIFLLFSVAL